MDSIIYNFDTIKYNSDSDYILQVIKNRKLSDIYHSHDFYEWIIVLDGSCAQIINEREIILDKNMCFLLCPGDRHKFIQQSDDLNIIALSVKKDEVACFENIFNLENSRLSHCQITMTHTQIRVLTDFYYASCEYEYKLLLANLIKIYIDHFNKKDEIPIALQSAMKEIAKPENLKGGVKKFTELSNYSQSQLARLMKKYFNTTLHEYILNIRLEAAYNGLILSKVNMEELAEKLGYASFSHFNKIFKKKYGITPAVLRKRHSSWTT